MEPVLPSRSTETGTRSLFPILDSVNSHRRLADYAEAPFTYPAVGATRTTPPHGYHVFRVDQEIGTGTELFERVGTAILGYAMQRGAGLRVQAGTPVAAPGTVLLLRLGPFRFPCRVVYVVDEPNRRGFAYGTLPGHPESGEELFVVERRGDAVVVTVAAFSRPGRWFTRAGGPAVRLIQRSMARRYIAAVRR